MTGLIAPRNLPDGARTWMAPEVADFIDRLRDLDPQLALVQHTDQSWSIWRVGEDGSEHCICRSKPGAALGPGLIQRLAESDSRRHGNKVVEDMIAHNERALKEHQERAAEAELEALERVYSKSVRGRFDLVEH